MSLPSWPVRSTQKTSLWERSRRWWIHRQLKRIAQRWTTLLTRDLCLPGSPTERLLQRETLAYVKCLARMKSDPTDSAAFPPEDPLPRLPATSCRIHSDAAPVPHNPEEAYTSNVPALHAGANVPAVSPTPFRLTPEMIERFCRLTGTHPASFAGAGASQASIVYYVVAFSLLTEHGTPSDLEMNRLLQRLQACRQLLSKEVERVVNPRSAESAKRSGRSYSIGRTIATKRLV